MGLAFFIASGRLIPRLLQRQIPTVSDCFLLASLLDCLGLFITDALTYRWGGMAEDDVEIPIDQLRSLKKVCCRLSCTV
jgi:hypothetical protein